MHFPKYRMEADLTMETQAKLLDMEAITGRMLLKTSSLREEVAAALKAWEATLGMAICFRTISKRWLDGDGRPLVEGPLTLHRSDFCMLHKQRQLPSCMKDDNIDLPRVFTQGEQGLVVRTCHAGATEILVPIWNGNMLLATIFIGQFRLRKAPAHSLAASLPVISRDRLEQLGTMAMLLRSYFLQVLRRLDAERENPERGREGVIMGYLRKHLSSGPTLQGLAESLALSESRTSHLVREVTGRSFQNLLEEHRLAAACDLLVDTQGKVAWIAAQTGFDDAAYFCRYFKKKIGLTPTLYRRRRRQQSPGV
jgi:AraC-like DNA-binding protein